MDIQSYVKDFFKLEKPPESWREVYHSMIVHTRGVKPVRLLEIKRPNEPQDVREYRLANYKPITKGAINQAIDSIYRVLFGSNWKVEYSTNLDEYLTEKEFPFMGERLDFKQLFFRHLLRLIFDDPNGLLVWMPVNSVSPDLPPIESPENEPIEVTPVYVNSDKIHHFSEEVISYEAGMWIVEIPMGNGRTRKEKKPYYHILTKDFIYRLVPFWNQGKIEWRLEEYYNLAQTGGEFDADKTFPTLVAHQFGGNIAFTGEGVRYYDSFFGGFTAFGDDTITAYSDNQAVRVRYNFPFVSFKGQLCLKCKGSTKISVKEGANKGQLVICDVCNGSGKTVPFTPFGHYVKEPPTPNDSEAFTSSPAVEFYSPDIGILDSSYNTWKDLLELAKDAVNLVFTKESQSGVAKEIDREHKYETLMKISNNFFELMMWSLDIIEAYRVPFASARLDSEVTKPVSFTVKTQGQLTEELTDLIAKEAPQSYIISTSNRLARRIYNDDQEMIYVNDILTKWDVLYGLNSSQVATLKASGGANDKDVARHVNGYTILARLAENNDLMSMTTEEAIALADAELQKLMPQTVLIETNEPTENT